MKTKKAFFLVPYLAWIILFVILPILLILWYSFTDSSHSFTLSNYVTFFKNGTFLKMMINSFWYAFLITLITLLISYPAAYAPKRFFTSPNRSLSAFTFSSLPITHRLPVSKTACTYGANARISSWLAERISSLSF